MVTQNSNPFVLPGFGQSGDMAQNPLMASMEMMRQAWQGLGSSGGLAQAAMTTPMSVEDLERRIGDLRAVENWLRMNLSMLSSTIQGLEVQRSTIATLKNFMSSPAFSSATPDGPSPLEVALGMVPGLAPDKHAAPSTTATDATENTAAASEAYAANAAVAAQGWWDMVQKQFDSLAVATAASLQGAEAAQAAAQPGVGGVSADTTLGKAPRKSAAKAAAPAKAAVKKTAAKKAAPRKQATAPRKKPN
ncbi:transcriptional regulator [Alcaligenaceae bacterium]|nr:transcriptional regulator [Alcaligenaceae bacterium]